MSIEDMRLDLTAHHGGEHRAAHDQLDIANRSNTPDEHGAGQLFVELTAELSQLHEALTTRTITAQATGILAARFELPTDHAWSLLRETSNMSNRKLNDIARIVIHTHDNMPFDEADQRIAVDLITVLDKALRRVQARLGVEVKTGQTGVDWRARAR